MRSVWRLAWSLSLRGRCSEPAAGSITRTTPCLVWVCVAEKNTVVLSNIRARTRIRTRADSDMDTDTDTDVGTDNVSSISHTIS
jgi:hypothetical protein